MLQDQFISRLLLIVVFGIAYIYTMMKMASCNSVETSPQKHIIFKIIGGINILLAISCLATGIYWLTQVQYPEQTIDFSYSANQIVRTSDKYVVWGYTTSEQSRAIMGITNVFSSLALAAYCFFYKKSDRKWWKKILRIAAIYKMMDERFETETNIGTEENTRFMPQNEDFNMNGSDKESKEPLTNDVSARTSLPHTEQNKKEETPSMDVVKYCRHCGKKVDYDSSTYCKYCGKEL